jgi:hypothetical protein
MYQRFMGYQRLGRASGRQALCHRGNRPVKAIEATAAGPAENAKRCLSRVRSITLAVQFHSGHHSLQWRDIWDIWDIWDNVPLCPVP